MCVSYSRSAGYRDLRRLGTLVFIVFLLFQVNSRNTVNLLHSLFNWLCTTVHRSWNYPFGGGGGHGAGDCWTVIGRKEGLILVHTDWEQQALWVVCSKWVYCVNAFRIGSSSSSFTTTSCLRESVTFQANIISRSVNTNHPISYFCNETIMSL